jgi:hypothetical protein
MTAGHGAKIGRQREAAIAALLTAPTVGDAAKAARVSEKTLRRWLAEPAFAEPYRAARRQALDTAIGTLTAATGEAVVTLRRNMSEAAPPAVQVRAAVALLDLALRGAELIDLAERVEQLEAAAREGANGLARGGRLFPASSSAEA